jgi:hypothetical protein
MLVQVGLLHIFLAGSAHRWSHSSSRLSPRSLKMLDHWQSPAADSVGCPLLGAAADVHKGPPDAAAIARRTAALALSTAVSSSCRTP